MKIGILGGTFDPIHEGHLMIADYVLKNCDLDHIEFIPCFQPPHRSQPIASPQDRLAMTKLAIKNFPQFTENDIEIKREGKSYTVDTMLQLNKHFPNNQYHLILGADEFSKFESWHEWKKIITLASIIVINRHDREIKAPESVSHFIKNNSNAKKVIYISITPIPISATQIRKDIFDRKKIISGLPDAVHDYILKKNIYQ